MLTVENCPMLVKHHESSKMVIPFLNGSYYQMAKWSQQNFRMKVFSDSNIVSIMNYLHGIK
jgi:hypothetical protein